MKFDAFISGSYEALAVTADCEKLVNWFPERLESPGATAQTVLYPTPGVEVLSTVTGASPGRAHLYVDGSWAGGNEFAVIGGGFYKIDELGAATLVGPVAYDTLPATISYNGDAGGELLVTSGTYAYIYDLTAGTLSAVAALAGKATMGAYLEGRFLCLDTATSTVYFSALNDGTSWTTGTDYFQRSFQADRWKAMRVIDRYIFLLGDKTSEAWYNAGGAFPYAAHPSGAIPYGILAPWSACVVGSDLYWLGTAGGGRIAVLRAAGLQAQVISSRPLEVALDGYTGADDAVGDAYAAHGHLFYLLSFDGANVTWGWDADMRIWHERGTWNRARGHYEAWRPRFHQLAWGDLRALDAGGGSIVRSRPDLSTDVDGESIRRLRRAPALSRENRRITYPGFELDLEPGLGNAVPPGDDPQVALRISNDGGKTWSAEMWRSAGKLGEYNKRVRWSRLGTARRRVFEVVVSDPVPWRLTGAYLSPEPVVS